MVAKKGGGTPGTRTFTFTFCLERVETGSYKVGAWVGRAGWCMLGGSRVVQGRCRVGRAGWCMLGGRGRQCAGPARLAVACWPCYAGCSMLALAVACMLGVWFALCVAWGGGRRGAGPPVWVPIRVGSAGFIFGGSID